MTDKEEVDTEDTEVVETTEQEQIARAQGWRPKEEAEDLVAAGKWVPADEFNRRKEFFDAIHKVNQKNKRLEEQLNALNEHHLKVKEAALKQAREELLNEKRAAAKDNDLERIVEIDEKLSELSTQPAPTAPANPTSHPEMEEFVKKNRWYAEDEDLQAFANGYGAKLEREKPTLSTQEVLDAVEKKVKETFPNKFSTTTTTQTQRVSSVSPSRPGPDGPAGIKKKKIAYNDLPDEAKDMHNKLVKSPRNPYGKLTSEQYLKDYALAAGLPYEE